MGSTDPNMQELLCSSGVLRPFTLPIIKIMKTERGRRKGDSVSRGRALPSSRQGTLVCLVLALSLAGQCSTHLRHLGVTSCITKLPPTLFQHRLYRRPDRTDVGPLRLSLEKGNMESQVPANSILSLPEVLRALRDKGRSTRK